MTRPILFLSIALAATCRMAQAEYVFWSDPNGIHVANLDGTNKVTLVNRRRANKLEPANGYVYWGDGSGIYRTNLFGNRQSTRVFDSYPEWDIDVNRDMFVWAEEVEGTPWGYFGLYFAGCPPVAMCEEDPFFAGFIETTDIVIYSSQLDRANRTELERLTTSWTTDHFGAPILLPPR